MTQMLEGHSPITNVITNNIHIPGQEYIVALADRPACVFGTLY